MKTLPVVLVALACWSVVDRPAAQEEPRAQVVPLTAETVEQGWRATGVLGRHIASPDDRPHGVVRNLIVSSEGRIQALLIEAESAKGEIIYRLPWSDIDPAALPGRIVADGGARHRQGLFGEQAERKGEFAVTEVIGDYARLQAGQGYGYVADVVFDRHGRMLAVLVIRGEQAGGGLLAFGFPGSTGPWDPEAGYYGLPYVTSAQADAAAVRVSRERTGRR
jgi:hypothetical protein